MVITLSFISFFKSSLKMGRAHSWALLRHDTDSVTPEQLAKTLADLIMQHHLRGCPQHYNSWKKCIDGGPRPTGTSALALRAFIKPVFGLPEEQDSIPHDHLEGYIAQYLWYFLSIDGFTGEPVTKVEFPCFKTTDPGGDGLVIHPITGTSFMFRLWEIKKCTGLSPVSNTVSMAYNQLDAKATEYLARYTVIGQEQADTGLSEFYSKLVDFWIDAKPEAAAGISVSISQSDIPRTCFTTFGKRFPKFTKPPRLYGMLAAIKDFSEFTDLVRKQIWTGL